MTKKEVLEQFNSFYDIFKHSNPDLESEDEVIVVEYDLDDLREASPEINETPKALDAVLTVPPSKPSFREIEEEADRQIDELLRRLRKKV